jgi:5-methylcytosine-specific restriction endonuclease McrA
MGVPIPLTKPQCYEVLSAFIRGSKTVTVTPAKAKSKPRSGDLVTDTFLASREWRTLRMVVLKKYGARCQCCGATTANGVRINVDHIKPRKLFPELALTESNLQVLCEDCNAGKGNWDQSDWRDQTENNIRLVR